jgi:hypothetical protein
VYINAHARAVLAGRKEMTTSQKISLAIITKINSGMTIEQAVDEVLGEGSYQKMAEDVWTAFRA